MEAVRAEVVELSAELSVVSSVLVSHLPHAVVVVQQADVLLLDHLDESCQPPGQLGALVREGVQAVLDKHPGVVVLSVGPACIEQQ